MSNLVSAVQYESSQRTTSNLLNENIRILTAATQLIVQKANSFLNQNVQLTMRCFKHVFIYLGHTTNRQKPMTEGIIVLCASDSVDYVLAHIYIQFHIQVQFINPSGDPVSITATVQPFCQPLMRVHVP